MMEIYAGHKTVAIRKISPVRISFGIVVDSVVSVKNTSLAGSIRVIVALDFENICS